MTLPPCGLWGGGMCGDEPGIEGIECPEPGAAEDGVIT